MKNRKWLLFISITMITWGIWGAFSEIPEKAGFPATFTYIAWALAMIPCAIGALCIAKWKFDFNARSILLGCMIGFLGAGGQLLLFEALRFGPAYIVFPFISMAPVVTITLSMVFLKERAGRIQLFGIAAALCAILFLSLQGDKSDSHVTGYLWMFFALLIFIMWGIQGFTMKFANKTEMQAESIFVYMAFTAICLIPVAYYMTNWQAEGINLSWEWAIKSFLIQLLNAVGALTLVYAYRYGKAILVSPMEGLAPLFTMVLSLIIYAVVPDIVTQIGMGLAVLAMITMSIE